MAARFAPLFAAALLLLCVSVAHAGELQRRITLLDGTAHTGIILERGDGYVVLQRSDGKAIELSLDTIDEIEVLTDGAQPEAWAPKPQRAPQWREAEEPPSRRPRFETDWADDLDDQEYSAEWRTRYRNATAAHALGMGATIPLMAIGLIETASAPMVIGGFNTQVRAGVGAIGVSLIAGSVGTSALSAALARKAYGVERDTAPLRIGIGIGLIGSAAYAGSFALAHAMWTGEVNNQNGSAGPAVGILIGLSIGAVVVGNTMVLSDAKAARDEAEREYKRSKRVHHAARTPPELLAVWAAPIDQGLSGGVAFQW